jgi:hypothetical protein
MADEVVNEKDFPCPCGKGILRIQVLEHDTYGSGRHSRWTLLCEDCKDNYYEPFLLRGLVRREQADEIEKRNRALYERRKAVGGKAAEKYLEQFKTHIKSKKFKTAMHDALGSESSLPKFRGLTRYDEGLDQAIEGSLKRNPARALEQIGVKDDEISDELTAIAEEAAALKQFEKAVPKFPIPDIDNRYD